MIPLYGPIGTQRPRGLLEIRREAADRAALHEALTAAKNQREAARILGVCQRTVQLLIRRHGYPDPMAQERHEVRCARLRRMRVLRDAAPALQEAS